MSKMHKPEVYKAITVELKGNNNTYVRFKCKTTGSTAPPTWYTMMENGDLSYIFDSKDLEVQYLILKGSNTNGRI